MLSKSPLIIAMFVLALGVTHAQKRQTITINAESPLRFDPPRFEISPGAKVKIRLGNRDTTDQPHNIVFSYPGKKDALVQAGMLLAEKGPELEYIPQDDSLVLAASSLLKPGDKGEVEFDVPEESGIYPYVCTFPGHGIVMYGAMYVGVPMPEDAAEDPNVPKNALSVAEPITKRPYVQRIFMPDSGPASIAVALPEGLNYVWDAGACTLRYVWAGDFIDPSKHFKGNGSALAKRLGDDPFWTGGMESPLGEEVEFLGYWLDSDKLPVFRYRIDGKEAYEKISIRDGALIRRFKFSDESLDWDRGKLRGQGKVTMEVVDLEDGGYEAIFRAAE